MARKIERYIKESSLCPIYIIRSSGYLYEKLGVITYLMIIIIFP